MSTLPLPEMNKIEDWLWEIPPESQRGMNVPARVYASERMLHEIGNDRSLVQLKNVASMPGIVRYALAMPDVHEGYGFPVGGVAAFPVEGGVISPGGIGYDINCGVRLLASDVCRADLSRYRNEIAKALYRSIPTGVGVGGPLRLHPDEVDEVMKKGAGWVVQRGYGKKEDLERIESGGCLSAADPASVSARARSRGCDQVGTLGAGNHFLEVLVVAEVYDGNTAKEWGLASDMVVVMLHTGSRGLGHQVATDYVQVMMSAMNSYGIRLADRELACAPYLSEEGQKYFAAMSCAANYAWANRQVITWEVREAWESVFGPSSVLRVVYDVAHNIAKVEEHTVGSLKKQLVVHRKGATRAFPDQPVIIPGSMGTSSYVLIGTEKSLDQTFGSCCHGAGRRMSRSRATREVNPSILKKELETKGIHIEAGTYGLIAEESPAAYKDIDQVVAVVEQAGIARKVVRMEPVVVVIG